MAFTENQQVVVDLFIAAYGRAPAQGGLDFFTGKLDSGEWTQDDIANYMMDTENNPEAATRFPDSGTTADKVETVFNNVLGRGTATQDGLDYWVNKVDNEPDYSMADLMKDVLNAAKEADGDKDTLANKAAVAEHFLAVVPEDEQAGSQPDLSSVTADAATVDAADAAIDALINPAIELTTGTDNLSDILTEDSDIIAADSGTLGSDDIIVDPSTKDSDVFNATLNSDNLTPTIMNVETINLTGEYAKVGLDLGSVIGATTINASASIIGAKAAFTSVSSLATEKIVLGENIMTVDITADAGGTTGLVTIDTGDASNVNLTGGAKDDSFAIDLNGGSTDLEVAGGTASAIESLTITSNGSANTVAFTDAATAGSLEKLILEGDQDITISGNIEAIMGSALEAGLLVEDNGAGISTFEANGSATAATAFVNRAAFDVIDLKQKVTNLTINDASKLLLNLEGSATATIDVNNSTSDMDAGTGSLDLDVATNQAKLVIGANAGAVNMTQDTADVVITELDTATTATADTTVVITGAKNVEITTWTNDSDEVLTAGDLEGTLTLGFASASALGATVISGKGDDSITLGALASGKEYTIITNDGNDTVDASLVGTAGDATIITGAGDDTINLGSASAVSNITIDAGEGTDEFQFAADLTIGADDSIANIENFVDGGSAGGLTLTVENLDTLATIEEFSGWASATAASAMDTLKIVGSNEDDTIDVSNVTFTKSTDAVQGGAGDDTVSFTTDNVAGETFIFEASASTNGTDTLNNFVVGSLNGDILDVSDLLAGSASTAGTAATALEKDGDNAYTSNAASATDIAGKIALLVDIADGEDITTADGLKTALEDDGEYDNFDLGSASASIIVTSQNNQTDDSHVFYAIADSAGEITVTEVGVVTQVDIDNLAPENFLV